MDYGSFTDMYRNKVRVYPSSNVEGGFWLAVESETDKQATTAHLSKLDGKVLIALLEKAIANAEAE